MHIRLPIALALLLPGCATPPEPKPAAAVEVVAQVVLDPQGYEVDPAGTWYDGDLHVHATGASNDAGKESTPETIATIARSRGLHFLVLTDHSNSTGSDTSTLKEDPALFNKGPEFPYWELVAQLSVPGQFLMIDGNEISPVSVGEKEPRGHIGCIPSNLDTFDRSGSFVDRPRGEVTGGQVLAQAKKRGCFAVVNHPYAPASWIRYDWTGMDYDALEVWNGAIGLDVFDHNGISAWRCDLLAGRKVTAVGGSDIHRIHNPSPPETIDSDAPLAWPTTSVRAQNLTWPDLMAGLRAGDVMIRGGESRLSLDAYDGNKHRATGKAIRWLRLRGQLDARSTPGTLRLLRATACDDRRPTQAPKITDAVLLEVAVQPGGKFDSFAQISGEAGVYTAQLLPDDDPWYPALSPAVVIAP